jgi:hypothetical protein
MPALQLSCVLRRWLLSQAATDAHARLVASAARRPAECAQHGRHRARVRPGRAISFHGPDVSLQGGNSLFHNQADRWPQAIDTGLAARQAEAFGLLVTKPTG